MIVLATALRKRLDQARADKDRGTSLMELVVGMSLMSIFMAIFTVAIVQMFSATNKIQAVENSSAQLNTAFDRLDKQVRYAAVIDQPINWTSVNPYWSVAFQNGDPTTTCTQLRVDATTLKERTWTVGTDGSSTSNLTGWSQLAYGVSNGASNQPFTLPTTGWATFQQLHLRFIASDGTGNSTTTSVSETTFTALNSAGAVKALANGSTASACAQTVSLSL